MNGLCPTAKKLCISVSCLDTPVLIKYCYSLLCSYSVCGQVNVAGASQSFQCPCHQSQPVGPAHVGMGIYQSCLTQDSFQIVSSTDWQLSLFFCSMFNKSLQKGQLQPWAKLRRNMELDKALWMFFKAFNGPFWSLGPFGLVGRYSHQ